MLFLKVRVLLNVCKIKNNVIVKILDDNYRYIVLY